MRLTSASLPYALASICSGQPAATPAPFFQLDRVFPLGNDRLNLLEPSQRVSIYGEHLGPMDGCKSRTEPKTLCDTQVLVGGTPAGLLYVQERQIDFRVPRETPAQGTTTLQVIYQGQPSLAVTVRLGPDSSVISLESPATAGMAVWLKVQMRSWDPPNTREANSVVGPACGFLGLPAESHHQGRIPLHLLYRFDQPGTYEVRCAFWNGSQTHPKTFQSAWTPIEILPAIPKAGRTTYATLE